MFAIEARNLTKSFRGVRAVDGIDLLIDEADIVGLLGPNGAGKTTTLMMILGITEPDGGEVNLLGERLPEGRVRALQKTNFTASYVSMPDRMRVREILSVYADLYGAPRRRIAEVIDLFDLGSLLRRYPSQLSSGQRTLLGLAKSMLNRPRLLILDEPTASLDPEVAGRVREILLAAHGEDDLTLLVTSHNMWEIERLCRRVVFIVHGRIVADGTSAQIAARYGAEDLEGTFRSIAEQARR